MTTLAELYGLTHIPVARPELYGLDPHAFCLEYDTTPLLSAFCRNPLHPGPCKGWKKKLGMVDPDALDQFEKRRTTNVDTKREKRKVGVAEGHKEIAANPQLAEHPLTAKRHAAARGEEMAGATADQVSRKVKNTKLNAAERKRFAKIKAAQIGSFAEAHGLTSDGKKYSAYAQKEIEKALLADNAEGGEGNYRAVINSISGGLSYSYANNHMPECNNPKEGDADCDGIAYEALRVVAEKTYVEALVAGDQNMGPALKNLDVISGYNTDLIKSIAKELGADLDGLADSMEAVEAPEGDAYNPLSVPEIASAVDLFKDHQAGAIGDDYGPLNAFGLWVGGGDFDALPEDVKADYKAFLVQAHASAGEGTPVWFLSAEQHQAYFGSSVDDAIAEELDDADGEPIQGAAAYNDWQKYVIDAYKPGSTKTEADKYSLVAGLSKTEYKALPDDTKNRIIDLWVANYEADKKGAAPDWWIHNEATNIGKFLAFIPDYWNGPEDNPTGTDPLKTGSDAQNNVASIIMQPHVLGAQKLDAIAGLGKEEYDDLPAHVKNQINQWLTYFVAPGGNAGGLKAKANGVMAKLGLVEGQQTGHVSMDQLSKVGAALAAFQAQPVDAKGYGQHFAKFMPIETLTKNDWDTLSNAQKGPINQALLAALADKEASKSMPLMNAIQAKQKEFGLPVGVGGVPLPGTEEDNSVAVAVATATGTTTMPVSPELQDMFLMATGAKKATLTQKLAAYAKVKPEEFGDQLNNAAKAKVVDDLIAMKSKFLDKKKIDQATDLQAAFNDAPVSTPMYGGSPAIIVSEDGLSELIPSPEVNAPAPGKTKQPGQTKIDIGQVSTAIDTAGLTTGQKTEILGAFKMQPTGYMLSHATEDVWDNVVAITAAFSGKKGWPKLTPGKVLAAIDEEHSKNLGVSNGHMQAEKVANWLATSNGKAYAQNHLTPDPDKVSSITGEVDLPKGVKLKPGQKVPKLKGPGKFDPNKPTTDFVAYSDSEALAERNAYFKQTGTKWTAKQEHALIAYTSASGPMNGYLRGETQNPGKSVQEMVIHAQSAMVPLQRDHRLFRGTDLTNFPADWRNFDSLKKKIGSAFTDDGFTSSSVGGSAAFAHQPVLLEIEAPAGTPAAYLNDISNYGASSLNEREMLLAAGTRYRVLGVVQAGGQIRVRVRVVS